MFVGYLWSSPALYEKYRNHEITKDTFTEPIWWFFYYIGKEMYQNGIRTLDDTTAYSFLTSRPIETGRKSYFEYYNQYGGYNSIEEIKEECRRDKGNDEYHFSEIQKYESLRKFQSESLIDVNNKDLVVKLTKMTLKQMQSFFQFKTNSIFSHINCGEVVEYNLTDDLGTAIDKMNEGEAMGLPLHDSPRLSKKIKGWRKGELIYLILSSGIGKSSIFMEKFIMALLENDEKGMMYANEESVWKARNLMLATISSKILHKPVNREKLIEGNFDQKTLDKLNAAKEWVEKKPKDIIKFYDLKKYRAEDVISRIQMMRPLGYGYAGLDTFKASSSADMARWEAFSNDAQAIFDCIKAEANNVGMLATVQLKIGKEYRYLDMSAIGKSLEIVEVASTVLMGRLIFADEFPGRKEALFTYNWKIDEFDGKWKKEEYKLDPEKTYLILFINKNRSGDTSEQIIYEVNYGINSFKEVAYAQMGKKSNSQF